MLSSYLLLALVPHVLGNVVKSHPTGAHIAPLVHDVKPSRTTTQVYQPAMVTKTYTVAYEEPNKAGSGPPKVTDPIAGHCRVEHWPMWDQVTIEGVDKYWDLKRLGRDNNNKGLWDNLFGCGLITGWKLTNKTKDSGPFDWELHLKLPMVNEGCEEDAMHSAGAPERLKCETVMVDWIQGYSTVTDGVIRKKHWYDFETKTKP